MPIRFSIPLPGPFTYSRSLGGGPRRGSRRRTSSEPGAGAQAVAAGLDRAAARIEAWGDEALERSRARRVEQGLPADPEPRQYPTWAEMSAERRERQARTRAEHVERAEQRLAFLRPPAPREHKSFAELRAEQEARAERKRVERAERRATRRA